MARTKQTARISSIAPSTTRSWTTSTSSVSHPGPRVNSSMRYLNNKARKTAASASLDENDVDWSDGDMDDDEKAQMKWSPGTIMSCLVNNSKFADVTFLVGPGGVYFRKPETEEEKSFPPPNESGSSSSSGTGRPSNPKEWNPTQVAGWIEQQGGAFRQYATVFREDGIDGESLLSDYKQDDDLYMVPVKPHKRKILREIQQLIKISKERKRKSESENEAKEKKRTKLDPTLRAEHETETETSTEDQENLKMRDVETGMVDENTQCEQQEQTGDTVMDTSSDKNDAPPSPIPLLQKQESTGTLDKEDNQVIERVHAIRAVLAAASPVFGAMLAGHMAESNTKEDIAVPDCSSKGFKAMMKYIYTGDTESIDEDNLIDAMYCAQKYQLDGLVHECSLFIKDKLSISNVCRFFCESEVWMSSAFMKYINIHAGEVLQSPDFGKLSKAKVINVIQSDKLLISGEIQIFRACIDWAENALKKKRVDVTADAMREELQDLLPYIRFPQMSPEEVLGEVYESSLLTNEQVLSIIMFWQRDGKYKTDFNTHARKTRYIDLSYERDFDENGVIYFIGTQGGNKSFTNPQTSGDVSVTMSSTEQGNTSNVTSRNSTQTYTNSTPNQHYILDLNEGRLLTPTYYTIRHGYASASYYPRNWVLEGNIQGSSKWESIKQHTGDSTINSPYGSGSWEIDPSDIISEQGGEPKYQKFRLRSTGLDHSGSNYLMICGIELYGKLYTREKHGDKFKKKKNALKGRKWLLPRSGFAVKSR